MDLALTGKTALVTGSDRRTGEVIARTLVMRGDWRMRSRAQLLAGMTWAGSVAAVCTTTRSMPAA